MYVLGAFGPDVFDRVEAALLEREQLIERNAALIKLTANLTMLSPKATERVAGP